MNQNKTQTSLRYETQMQPTFFFSPGLAEEKKQVATRSLRASSPNSSAETNTHSCCNKRTCGCCSTTKYRKQETIKKKAKLSSPPLQHSRGSSARSQPQQQRFSSSSSPSPFSRPSPKTPSTWRVAHDRGLFNCEGCCPFEGCSRSRLYVFSGSNFVPDPHS